MKVLLITFSFPPVGGVGVLRALSLARYLPEHGVEVEVLTARNAPAVGRDESLLRQVPEGVAIHRCWTLDLPFAVRKWIKKRVAGGGRGGQAAAGTGAAAGGVSGGSGGLKRLIADLLLPDPQVGWLPFALPAGKRIIRRSKVDAVVITVPPFSSVRLATLLRKTFPALPIVVDFRDEWITTTLNLVSFNNNQRARDVATKTEGEAVRDATAVVAVTEAARLELMGRYPGEDAGKFRYVANGFETRPARVGAERADVGATDGRVLLTYIGTVYGSTDPGTFVEAVLGLPEALRARLRVRFIGHVETGPWRAKLERLGATVELLGFMPQAEALRALDETDYLLLITHDRINVSAKFYDYLSGSRPIVAAVAPGGDVRRLLEETGAGVWADVQDAGAIRAMLVRVLEGGVAYAPDRERIGRFHRGVLAGEYAALLRGLVGDGSKARAEPNAR